MRTNAIIDLMVRDKLNQVIKVNGKDCRVSTIMLYGSKLSISVIFEDDTQKKLTWTVDEFERNVVKMYINKD